MSTTTIRVPEELKQRIARLAEAEGVSAHSFILEAIEEKANAAERRSEFHAEAERRWQEFQQTGEAVPWEEMREYIQRLARGENPLRPVARKIRP